MTSFLNKSFSVVGVGAKFTENWERTFSRRDEKVVVCACSNPRVGYLRNKVPICIRCGGEIRKKEGKETK